MNNAKKIILLTQVVLLFMQSGAFSQKQMNVYKYSAVSLPEHKAEIFSFYVNEGEKIFLPINGGIYLPEDSLWFLPPSENSYFTSFVPNVKDTGFFVLANSDSSELFYLKGSLINPIQKYSVVKLKKGIYSLIFKNNVCYIWGYDSKYSKIGIVTNKDIKWILNINGLIKQVQVNNSSDIFFCMDSSVYKLNSRERVLKLNEKIYGFSFTQKGEVVVSSVSGVGIRSGDQINFIATGINGPVEIVDDKIFVLSRADDKIYKLFTRY